MTTVATVIDQALSWLYPGGQGMPAFDILEGAITSGATSMTVEGLQTYLPQTVIEFDEYVNNLPKEQAVTREAESTTAIDLNERGYLNTTAAAHSDGIKVWIEPRFTNMAIFEAVQAVVASLYGMGLYRLVQDISLTYDSVNPVALPSGSKDLDSVVAVHANEPFQLREGRDYILLTTYDPPKFWFFGNYPQGSSLVVNVRKDFTVPTLVTDDLTTTCGVPASLVYHFPMAVAGYLLSREELPAVVNDEIRARAAAEGVQAGARRSIGEAMFNTFEQKWVQRELNNQIRRTPIRIVSR